MSKSMQQSKYDINVNPVYQVDWNHTASGKRVANTKRRVKFRFGFSNREAIDQGLSGNDCRGEEHEVVLVWSLTSGKRLVVADGVEVHFSSGKFTDNTFQTSWHIAGGHLIKIIAHAAPPLFPTPGFRQFDLIIDGLSFFDMPKIYELGTRAGKPRTLALQASSEASYYDNGAATDAPAFATSGRRRTMERYSSMPALPPSNATPMARPAPERYNSMPALPPSQPVAPPAPLQPPVLEQAPLQLEWTQAPPVHDEFAPAPPAPPSPAEMFQHQSQQILSAYTPSPQPALPALTYTPHYSNYEVNSPGATSTDVSESSGAENSFYTPVKEAGPPILKPTMQPMAITEMVPQEPEPTNEVDRAMKSLVNLDDISFSLVTPEQAKMTRKLEEMKVTDTTKSRPMPPSSSWVSGRNASLADIKTHATKREPNKEVMRTHAFDPRAAQAGMMVVYGAPQQQGFGAGAYYAPPQPAYAASRPLYTAY